jgi:hypothetical protein
MLTCISDLKDVYKALRTVTFAFQERLYARNTITGISVLHYKALILNNGQSYGFKETPETICDYAEIVVHFGNEEGSAPGDITRSILHCA